MDSSAFQDRHPFLDPEQWLVARQLREKEPRPAAIAGMRRE
jgi:hypothetical protein